MKRGIGAATAVASDAGVATSAIASVRELVNEHRWRVRALVALTGGAALFVASSFLTPAFSGPPTLYAATETLLTLLALGSAWLLRSRFRETHRQSDLLLALAVFSFGLIRLTACAIPAALNPSSHTYLSGIAVCGDLLVAALVASAAFAPREPSPIGLRHPDRLLLAASVGILAGAGMAGVVLHGSLVGASRVDGRADTARVLGVAVVVSAAALLVLAAVGFRRNKSTRREGGTWLLADAAVILAVALLSELNPRFVPDTDSATEALRILGYAMIGGAALRWQIHARKVATRAAAVAERQRVARDLHDGLAQDLALIVAHGEHIAADVGADHPVVAAARRALQISRCAIAELSDPDAADAHEALEAIASEFRRRFDIAITLDVQVAREFSPEMQEDVGRIVREAIVNAVRHGGAKNVVVSLHDVPGHIRLRVLDDGRGIGTASDPQRREGFGLRSIRERANALGGYVRVRQLGTEGTVLDVVLS